MRIKINKCSDSLMWYSDRVNEVFEVLYILREAKGFSYWVNTKGLYNTKNFIHNYDCSEVNDNE